MFIIFNRRDFYQYEVCIFSAEKILYDYIIGSQLGFPNYHFGFISYWKSMKTDILMHSMTLMYSWEIKPGKLTDNAVLYALCGRCITKGAVGVYK